MIDVTTSMADGSVHQLELVPLGVGGWRLCDRSLEADDPVSIVAYVEQTADGIEVVWLQGRSGVSFYAELADVFRAAVSDLSPGGVPRSTRPIEIPHFAPRTTLS
ncbi:hypothetical protein ABZ477_08015 [Microbacterium sp. NPDC019599]|uniref:hypothetical protein n=1 Tax=Microbacterium sp. NPDC019599 TaxID=3154690 RepID=UPI0033FAAF5C